MLDPEIFDKLNPENESIVVPMVRPLNKDKLTNEEILTVNTILYGLISATRYGVSKTPNLPLLIPLGAFAVTTFLEWQRAGL